MPAVREEVIDIKPAESTPILSVARTYATPVVFNPVCVIPVAPVPQFRVAVNKVREIVDAVPG